MYAPSILLRLVVGEEPGLPGCASDCRKIHRDVQGFPAEPTPFHVHHRSGDGEAEAKSEQLAESHRRCGERPLRVGVSGQIALSWMAAFGASASFAHARANGSKLPRNGRCCCV